MKQSLAKIKFPDGFSLSVNEKHYSNKEEVIKHLNEIVIPYIPYENGKVWKNPISMYYLYRMYFGANGR